MMFVQRHNFEVELYIKRMASKSVDEEKEKKALGKRSGEKSARPKITYEIINVNNLLRMLHEAVRQSVGSEVVFSEHQMTKHLVFHMLLTGSDYSRKTPLIGPSFVWENLQVSMPLLLCCSAQDEECGTFSVHVDACVDTFFAEMYRCKYSKHASVDGSSFDVVMADLHASKLAPRTKAKLPDKEFLQTSIKNILWIMQYWQLINENPLVDMSGQHGFYEANGKLCFGTT